MRIPESLASLFDYGVLDEVVRPLMSGKEAQVYLVVSGGKYAVAKIYKDAHNRTFKHRAEYTEGRRVRNTRDQRAIGKRSKHGRQQDEAAWRSTEVDMIHRLHAAGVRVPVPHHFVDGVLVMELILDANGQPAPRLGDLAHEPDAALAIYQGLIREVVKMLCAGVVHGDLSEFNVLMGADGPVIIDFPQSVDSAHNQNAKKLLVRDVENLHRFVGRFMPSARRPPYAQEMWHLYEQNLLTPDTRLRGDYRAVERRVNTASVLDLIDDAARDERKRRDALGLRGGPPQPQYRPGGGNGRNDAAEGRGVQRGGPPQNRAPAAKREPAVYQGLPNEGLSSFKYLLDKKPRNGGGQRPQNPQPNRQQPRPNGQAPNPNRPRAEPQHNPNRPRNEQPHKPNQPRSAQPHNPNQPHPAQPHNPNQPRPAQPHNPNQPRPAQPHNPNRPRNERPQNHQGQGQRSQGGGGRPTRPRQPEIERLVARPRPVPPKDPAPAAPPADPTPKRTATGFEHVPRR